MKTLRTLGLVLTLLALSTVLGVTIAAADGPVASLYTSNIPYIDNQVHTLQPSGSMWFRFGYGLSDTGERTPTTISLLYGNKSGVNFEVWTADETADIVNNDPIGRGTTAMIQCDTGMCASDNLTWAGIFGSGGTYYVRVVNTNPFVTTAKLSISGNGVFLATPIAVTGPSAAAVPVVMTDDPGKSAVIDGKQKTLPANSAMWFRYNYNIGESAHPVNLVRLLNGAKNGFKFEVYSPEILGEWWRNDPIGVGTIEMQACDTGWCQTSNLSWSGAFGASGTYFVRVFNDTTFDLPFQLTLQ